MSIGRQRLSLRSAGGRGICEHGEAEEAMQGAEGAVYVSMAGRSRLQGVRRQQYCEHGRRKRYKECGGQYM
jgi:hypothetical protein